MADAGPVQHRMRESEEEIGLAQQNAGSRLGRLGQC